MKKDTDQIRRFERYAAHVLQFRQRPLWYEVVEDEHRRLLISGTSIPLVCIGRWLSSNPSDATAFDLNKVREDTEELERLVEDIKPETNITFRFRFTGG